MLHLLERHPFRVRAPFRRSRVLAFAFPEDLLSPLLPTGLELDAWDGCGVLGAPFVRVMVMRRRAAD